MPGITRNGNPNLTCVQHADRIQDGILQKDTLFTSPSAASSFVVYASSSGMAMWRNEQGKTLKALESHSD
jgi:hypothetical protein